MTNTSFEIILFDDETTEEVWRGPFAEFVKSNELSDEEADGLVLDFSTNDGHSAFGGGAAPLYLIMAPSFMTGEAVQ